MGPMEFFISTSIQTEGLDTMGVGAESGAAVVNEASLTGESVPQMKEKLSTADEVDKTKKLDMNGADRVHMRTPGMVCLTCAGK